MKPASSGSTPGILAIIRTDPSLEMDISSAPRAWSAAVGLRCPLASYARSSRTSHARLLFTMDDRGDLHTIVGEELRAARLPTSLERTIFQRTRSEELHLDKRVSWRRHAPCGVHGKCHCKQTCTRVTTASCHELRRVGIALRGFQPL